MKKSPNSKVVEALREELLVVLERTMAEDDLSQGEVARRIGALRHNVNKVMRRKIGVTLDFLVGVADALGLEVNISVKRKKD